MHRPGMRVPSSPAPDDAQGTATRRIRRGLVGLAAAAVLMTACQPSPGPNPAIKLAANPFPAHLVPNPNVPGDPDRGRELFSDTKFYPGGGCGFCHTFPSISNGTFPGAPNLNNVSLRPTLAGETIQNSPATMKAWIMDPPNVKPNARMPKLNVSDQEAQDLVAFIFSQPYNAIGH